MSEKDAVRVFHSTITTDEIIEFLHLPSANTLTEI